MNYLDDKRIKDVKTSVSDEVMSNILSRPWFKVVRRENTPLWESLIRVGGCLDNSEVGFKNPMQDFFALNFDTYAPEDSFRILKKNFVDSSENDVNYLTNFFSDLEKNCIKIDEFARVNSKKDFESLVDSEIVEIFDDYVNQSLKILSFLWPPLGPEEWLLQKISDEITKHIDPLKDYEKHQSAVQLLVASEIPSLIQEKELAITELAAKLKTEIDGNNDLEKFKDEIDSVYFKYAWINDSSLKFEYESRDNFLNDLKQKISSNPNDALKKITEESLRIKRGKANLIKELKLNGDLVQYANQASNLAHWRLLRTEKIVEVTYHIRGLFKSIEKRFNVSDIRNYYYWEIGNVLYGEEVDRDRIESRGAGFGLMITKDQVYDLDKNSAQTVKNQLEQKIDLGKIVKGNVACRGQARGIVRIMLNTKQFSTFNDGEILVTAMTTPEFVPIMKKAAAIVTDEGGISCHAAIVSRELKIPCVIGTKNATKVLKDGDIVDVDAVKGIVKILNK